MQILLILVIAGLVLRPLTLHQDLTTGLFLQLLLVVTLRTNQQPRIVEVAVLRKDDLTLNFGCIVHHRENTSVQPHGEVTASLDKRHTNG